MAEPARTPDADLAVVVVNYNAGDHLTRCLRSVFAAAGAAHLDVIVVDNASHDGSADRAVRSEPQARLIRNERNLGFAAGANVGIRATSAPYVFLLNPDAEVAAGTLSGLVKLADDRPRAGAIGVLVRETAGGLYPSARKIPSIGEAVGHAFLGPVRPDNRFTRSYTMAHWDRTSEREVDWVSGSSMLLRRKALDEVGPFDDGFFMYAEDVDLCTRLRAAGWRVLFAPELEVVHEGGVSTGRSKRMILEHSRSVYRYFEKHRARGWRRILLPFAWAALRVRAAIVACLRDAR